VKHVLFWHTHSTNTNTNTTHTTATDGLLAKLLSLKSFDFLDVTLLAREVPLCCGVALTLSLSLSLSLSRSRSRSLSRARALSL
jgi:hypothetical protein